jgi:hypothetical protein
LCFCVCVCVCVCGLPHSPTPPPLEQEPFDIEHGWACHSDGNAGGLRAFMVTGAS